MDRFLFPVPSPSYDATSYPSELIWLPHRYPVKIENQRLVRLPGDVCTPALFLNFPSARHLLIFFHSNAEDIGRTYPFCLQMLEQFHVHVLAVEYPGYGIARGSVSAEGVLRAADAAMRFVKYVLKWDDDSILIMGRSIGTAPAIHIASTYPKIFGLILISPFTSISDLLGDKLGPFVKFLPFKERFDNTTCLSGITSHTMILHGQRDTVVSVSHGRHIFERLSCRKLFVSPSNMSHNSHLFLDPRFMAVPMLHFFSLPDYSISDDFAVPQWAFDPRLGSNVVTASEVEWNSTAFKQNADVRIPKGDTSDVPRVYTEKSFSNRPPRSKGDGAAEDTEAMVSVLGLNNTHTKSLSDLSIRLPESTRRGCNSRIMPEDTPIIPSKKQPCRAAQDHK
eukprot:GEMP01051575.1.p1 GENE.GEMP01051575.1~~GEMP01051575.1.p1  ORF type:complete len:394 (+),score=55.88 GEMP01051575.1:50-1231(+)